ncbi:MAG: hypothetical protein Q8R53_01520 [Nanoarchaeota archaeon]|nr:hypothetical protein [Nanoarchaeota archaeon]
MTGEQLMDMTADDRIKYLRGSVPEYDNRINQILDRIIPAGSATERIRSAFRRRVEDYFCQPGGTFGGSALDHLPQGYPTSTITQAEYVQLYAAACGLAAFLLTECGFAEQAQPAAQRYGEMRVELDF